MIIKEQRTSNADTDFDLDGVMQSIREPTRQSTQASQTHFARDDALRAWGSGPDAVIYVDARLSALRGVDAIYRGDHRVPDTSPTSFLDLRPQHRRRRRDERFEIRVEA